MCITIKELGSGKTRKVKLSKEEIELAQEVQKVVTDVLRKKFSEESITI